MTPDYSGAELSESFDRESDWAERWSQINEMEIGSQDPLPEFQETVAEKMEELGNEVGRPLVMKVSIDVYNGELSRPEERDSE
jgi:hypothetical protein